MSNGPGKRSFVAPWFGGGAKPESTATGHFGFRSVLAFFVGGGYKPLSKGAYAGPRSVLAYWLGGGNLPPFHPLPAISFEDGVSHAKHHGPAGRFPIDDPEVIEFLEWWTAWNDIE